MARIAAAALSASKYKSIKPLPATNPRQAGPNCGLYALSYVMRHWYVKLAGTSSSIPEPLPARKLDVEQTGKLPIGHKDKGGSLRQMAKVVDPMHPLTFLGELFSADSLVMVAKASGFAAKAHVPETKDYLSKLFKLIDANHPAIVSLDVDQDIHTVAGGKVQAGPRSGCPGKFGGEHAHWGVIVAYEEGIFSDDVVMFHWENYFQFAAKDLRDSSGQLIRFSGQTWYKPVNDSDRVKRDKKGEALIDPKTNATTPTPRGGHWQKLETVSENRNTSLPGTSAWTGGSPGAYATKSGVKPPQLTTLCHGQVVKTVFGNTNLNLRNVMIEVVPPGVAFA